MDYRQYQKIEEYMCSCMQDTAHDKQHVYRVLYIALDIAATEPQVDMDCLIAACLLHDIGRKAQLQQPMLDHAIVGAEMAYQFLITIGYPVQFAERVKDCIAAHRYRTDFPPQTIEAKILFDADKIDVTGALGIARSLLYQGATGVPLYTICSDKTINDGQNTSEPSFFAEYHYKLKHVYDRFFTERAAAIAKERKQITDEFYNHLFYEVQTAYQTGEKLLRQFWGEEKGR